MLNSNCVSILRYLLISYFDKLWDMYKNIIYRLIYTTNKLVAPLINNILQIKWNIYKIQYKNLLLTIQFEFWTSSFLVSIDILFLLNVCLMSVSVVRSSKYYFVLQSQCYCQFDFQSLFRPVLLYFCHRNHVFFIIGIQ